MSITDRIIVIVGPTAGGKTELAVAVAQHFGGEIISADSMQIYKHLNAGTAKPDAQQLAVAEHHLIDIVDPTQRFTVADWLEKAEALIAKLHRCNKLPIVVGGTNLYIKALLEGMFEGPATDQAFRDSLKDSTSQQLHERLVKVDRESASRIHPNDRKRITRALEVFHTTGRSISELQKQWQPDKYRHNPIMIGLRWGVAAINRRINARVKRMFFSKLPSQQDIEYLPGETKRLLEAGLLGDQAREAIGTKQVIDHLEGRCTLDEAIEKVKIETRRFAKAQRTWLKQYRGVQWLDADKTDPKKLIQQTIEYIENEMRP